MFELYEKKINSDLYQSLVEKSLGSMNIWKLPFPISLTESFRMTLRKLNADISIINLSYNNVSVLESEKPAVQYTEN